MNYISSDKFGKNEFYNKVTAKDKPQDTYIVKANNSLHDQLTQIKTITDQLEETNINLNFSEKHVSNFKKDLNLNEI